MADPGHPRAGHAQPGHEPREEDGLSPVATEEALRARQQRLQPAEAEEEPAPVGPADPVAHVVAEDRAERREPDHRPDRVVAARGQDARSDERRLAGNPHPGRFEGDDQEEEGQPVLVDDVLHARGRVYGWVRLATGTVVVVSV